MRNDDTGSTAPTVNVQWPREGVAVVVLGGEHDLNSAAQLRLALTQTLEKSVHLVVDLSSTKFIDSSTIGALISAKARADADERRFNLLLGTEPIIERVLEITGVLTVLNRVHRLEDAIGR